MKTTLARRQFLATAAAGSLECSSYVQTHVEFGEPWLKGRRQVPFGFGWLAEGASPYRELPMRAARVAYREYSANPDLSDAAFQAALGRELFGPDWQPAQVEDTLELCRVFGTDRDWTVPAPLTTPGLVESRRNRGRLDAKKRASLRDQLARVRAIAACLLPARGAVHESSGLRQPGDATRLPTAETSWQTVHPTEIDAPLVNPYCGWGLWAGPRYFDGRPFTLEDNTRGFGVALSARPGADQPAQQMTSAAAKLLFVRQHSWHLSFMKKPILNFFLLCLGGGIFMAPPAAEAVAARRTISLDGTWQLAEGATNQRPAQFDYRVPVPGLVDQAVPAIDPRRFAARAPFGSPVSDGALKDRAFWYRREFKIEGDVPAVASLLMRKAAYGSTVYLNGAKVGESQAAFTASRYDVRAALRGRGAANELVIRVGANRDSLPRTVPRGQDYEKARYIPGLFDSVELELSGTPHFVDVQAAPDITNQMIRVQARIRNTGPERAGTSKFVVREAKSGKVAGHLETAYPSLAAGAETTVDVRIPVARCRLWSPEDPFLYTLEVSTDADTFETRFGMREFHFEPRQGDRPGRAYLNGKPYFMRGSNVTLYRFFEDPDRGDLPWSERWVRRLHRRFKEMHWNSLRYCIGFPPEAWYRIADEEGFLIQDEFPLWGDETGQLDSAILARQYADWMRERWNHPCVVIWDSQNETRTEKTGAAYSQVRALDLSNRPWDNGYAATLAAADVSEAHPYHFTEPSTTLAQAVSDPVGMPNFNGAPNPENRHAYVINEYGWLWLNRDGTPTTLTSNLFARLAGKDAPPSKLFPLAARLLAADTEFWRCRRQAAAVMHFCALGYSRPDGQTSDHWLDVKRLVWEPEFYRYVRDAFAPVGLMVDFAKDKVLASAKPTRIPIVVINDLERPWSGPVTLRLQRGGHWYAEMKKTCRLEPLGQAVVNFDVTWPTEPGPCRLEAELRGADGNKVRSLRDTEVFHGSPGPGHQGHLYGIRANGIMDCIVLETGAVVWAERLAGPGPKKTTPQAKLLQLGKDMLLQRIALMLLVAERRADEDADDGPETWYGVLIAQVARQCGQSLRQLQRRFQEAIGVAPQEFLMRTRVLAALRLLEETRHTAGEIAERCGFMDASRFAQHFKKRVGISPVAYRRRLD